MAIKNYSNLFILLLFAAATIAGYMWLIGQPVFEVFVSWVQENFVLYFILLVCVKMIGIVWPPLPGGLFTLGSIPVIGWFPAFLAEAIGGLSGASIAYYLGKKYGYKFLRKIFNESVLSHIQHIKINKKREFEAIFFLRLFTSVVTEAVSYGSGLLGIKYRNFFFATCGSILTILPIFYFARELFSGRRLIFSIPLATLALVFWKMRGRYFE